MTTVVFAMEWVPQYRAPFYDGLRTRLAEVGVEVRLVHGDPPPSRRRRRDDDSLPWAERVENRFWTIRGLEVTWQPALRQLKGADLVILQQETGLALNYLALARARLGGPPVALWGHGHNFNPLEADARAEWVKARVTPWADWIFAYTERSAEVFSGLGVPRDRITVVRNAMDTRSLTEPEGEPNDDIAQLIAGLRARQARVGWIVSALDRWKRVDLLLDIVDATRKRLDDFEFVAVGAGSDAHHLSDAAAQREWLHVVGPRFGADKAALGEVAEVTVHPGLAGLHVIEAFATASPMVTAAIDYHSHEIEYLDDGRNALVLDADADAQAFADAVAGLLTDRDRLATLQSGCRAAAATYTLDAMIDRFAEGIIAALEAAQ